MTCRNFRKYVGAFADGELDTESNAEALEHLNICLACAERVTEVHRMKEALRRVFEPEVAPVALGARVRSAIRTERPRSADSARRWLHRLVIPTGVAAAVVAAVAVWQVREPSPAETVTVAARFVSQVQHAHQMCCEHHAHHHDPRLGRDLDTIAERLSARLPNIRVIAPDLEKHGFRFHSANVCPMMNTSSAHLLYEARDGRMLSVITMAAKDCEGVRFRQPCESDRLGAFVEQTADVTVLGWAVGCSGYILCGDAPAMDLYNLALAIRDGGQ